MNSNLWRGCDGLASYWDKE